MIVDTSALVAIADDEPECDAFAAALARDVGTLMSAATYLEAGIVLDRRRSPTLSRSLDELIAEFVIDIAPVTAEQARIARAAYRDFGRGSGHPAHLNFGDCLTYALAKDRREPLLYKGDDFGHTDVEPAA